MIQGLGERLQQKRILAKLSPKAVANILGVSPAIVSNYERGERVPSVEVLMDLANLYHCSTDYLLGLNKDSTITVDISMLTESQQMALNNFLQVFINKE